MVASDRVEALSAYGSGRALQRVLLAAHVAQRVQVRDRGQLGEPTRLHVQQALTGDKDEEGMRKKRLNRERVSWSSWRGWAERRSKGADASNAVPFRGAYQACHEPERREHLQVGIVRQHQLLEAMELPDGGGHLLEAVTGEVEADEFASVAKALW